MIEGYDEIIEQWSAPSVGACTSMMHIEPDEDLRRWAVQQTVTVLANADYYYTKSEVEHLIQMATASGVTRAEVEEMIARAIATKANQSDLEALSAQVASNTERILNTYTKQEVNGLLASYYTKLQTNNMFANYSKVENTTLILNSENIT
jgi:uncharacterized protein (DUF1015 family)